MPLTVYHHQRVVEERTYDAASVGSGDAKAVEELVRVTTVPIALQYHAGRQNDDECSQYVCQIPVGCSVHCGS